MSLNTVHYSGRAGSNFRLLSGNVWDHLGVADLQDPTHTDGFFFFDDFFYGGAAIATNDFVWTGGTPPVLYDGYGTAGTTQNQGTTSAGAYIGELMLDVDADDEENYLTIAPTYGSMFGEVTDTAGNNFRLSFEARIKFDNVDSGAAALAKAVGLINTGEGATGTIGADGATMSVASGFVGFFANAADGNTMDAVYSDGTQQVHDASDSNLDITADTYAKFGLKYDGQKLYYFVNNVQIGAGVLPSATNFPDAVGLCPFFGIRQHGTGDFEGYLDWWAFGVRRDTTG